MKQLYMLLLIFLTCSSALYAQQRVIGNVYDETGEELIAATVIVEGTTNGTVTDFEGAYAIDVAPGTYNILVSYVGYQSMVKPVTVVSGQDARLDFTIGEDSELLDEVVVVGYGSVDKDDLTGAVNVVDEESFNRGAIVSADQLITGKIAGVQVISNSGEPGGQSTIRIRGGTSLTASNDPLFVIDGVPVNSEGISPGGFQAGRNPLNFINPNDIENVTVLKDASAAAIYGSRGANGVILITTKTGGFGAKPTLTYDMWVSSAQEIDRLQVLNADQYRSAVTNFGPGTLDKLGSSSTDWQDQILQTAFGQNHSLTLTGGGEKTGFRASIGYLNQEGIIKTSETERINMSLSLNQKLIDDRLNMRINLKGANTIDRISPNGVIGAALNYDPTLAVFDANSPYNGYAGYDRDELNAGNNPLSELEQTQDYNRGWRGLGNIEFDYQVPFIDGLSWKLNLGFDYEDGARTRYLPTTIRSQFRNPLPGEARREDYTRTSSLLETYGKYDFKFLPSVHQLNFSAGYSWQGFDKRFPRYQANGFPNDQFGVNNPNNAEQIVLGNTVTANRIISFWGRLNYELNNKYLLTATIRRDGSTKFGPENQWGNFPSVAGAWRVSEEGFYGDGGVMSTLKFRVGWGITGNQDIPDYLYLPRFSQSDLLAQYQFGDEFISTLRPDAYDESLKWEETTTINLGLDFGFLNDRINGTIDVYKKNTTDVLFNVQIPALSNLSNFVTTNIGEVENQGIELGLNTVIIDKRNLKFDVGFNVAFNKNEVLSTISDENGNSVDILTGGIDGSGIGNNIQILRAGEEASSFYPYQHLMDSEGKPRRDDIDYNDDGDTDELDVYADLNGDGTINDSDRYIYNSPAPTATYGLTAIAAIGGLSLNMTWRAQSGNYVYNNTAASRSALRNLEGMSAPPQNVLARALEDGFDEAQFLSDYFVEDASFIKLDNLTLGYDLSRIWDGKNARIYVTGQNLLVLTDYTGLDPEVGNSASLGAPQLGLDKNTFPRARTFLVGLNVQF